MPAPINLSLFYVLFNSKRNFSLKKSIHRAIFGEHYVDNHNEFTPIYLLTPSLEF